MDESSKVYVGLDVHKETTAIARALPERESRRAIAWKAQLRPTERYAKLQGRGVTINKVCVAVARELAGFVWAVARNASSAATQVPAAMA